MLKRQGKLKLRSRESRCIAAGNTIAYFPKGAVIEGTEYGLDKSSAFRMLVCLKTGPNSEIVLSKSDVVDLFDVIEIE